MQERVKNHERRRQKNIPADVSSIPHNTENESIAVLLLYFHFFGSYGRWDLSDVQDALLRLGMEATLQKG